MKCNFCERKAYASKPIPVCNMHYQRWRRYGRYDAPHKEKWYTAIPNRNGYLSLYNGYTNPRLLIHRLVMEEHLGRKLTKEEIVHHKDGNILNNAIENLEVMSRAQHVAIHKRKVDWSQYKVPKPREKYGPSCIVESCMKAAKTRGLCIAHYTSYKKQGNP